MQVAVRASRCREIYFNPEFGHRAFGYITTKMRRVEKNTTVFKSMCHTPPSCRLIRPCEGGAAVTADVGMKCTPGQNLCSC
ncbi:hypothetical protein EYF80_030218 [Liparis tanakae]|uniref:Uncharacterized protein n=1 Tax=Liparis tanakae TaxID=230148 RepID=A0A4Z2H144_9TELE|nr:hypothetical protein EYF80_030218 [Liparis tanakae]